MAVSLADFDTPYAHGLVRVAVAVPRVTPADPAANTDRIAALAARAEAEGAAVVLFPELSVSGYAIDDLLGQEALLSAVQAALARIVSVTAEGRAMVVVGAPLAHRGRLFNCAVVIHGGRVLGVVPKTFLPNYREYYERRWFASGLGIAGGEIEVAGGPAPFGTDLLFEAAGPTPFNVHPEICEDLWTPTPPSTLGAMGGAEILLNLSASNAVIGKADVRRTLCAAQSTRCLAAYVYAAAGPGESTTDLAWDGQGDIHELGALLAETARFPREDDLLIADVDVGRIRQERLRTGSFGEAAARMAMAGRPPWRRVAFDFTPPKGALGLKRRVERYPYVPSDPARLAQDCYEAWNIQVQGLAERLRATGLDKLVIGVSGGLDSTEALIVACKAVDWLALPHANVFAYTLPGFATSDATKSAAWSLMRALGVTAAEIDIRPAAEQMLADLGHPAARGEKVYDTTYENVQAGLRTDYLFRLANRHGALVVGTGDLSELALGWCTYGVGDQMSHYNPNAGVSKTLIQHLTRFAAREGGFGEAASRTLLDVLASEITPELVPVGADGKGQSTEAAVGPYPLQDFNLFHLLRYGLAPSKIAYLSWCTWRDAGEGDWPDDIAPDARVAYDLPTIKRWLALFLKRFFANQFKRSAMPNGPKVSPGGALSPRGDWRMPSDASPAAWLAELEANTPSLDTAAP